MKFPADVWRIIHQRKRELERQQRLFDSYMKAWVMRAALLFQEPYWRRRGYLLLLQNDFNQVKDLEVNKVRVRYGEMEESNNGRYTPGCGLLVAGV